MHKKGCIARKLRQWLNFECGAKGNPFNKRSMELIMPKGMSFFA